MEMVSFGKLIDLVVLVPTHELANAEGTDYFDYFNSVLNKKLEEEYSMPKDSVVQWLGYKYLTRINIHSVPIQFCGVVREK